MLPDNELNAIRAELEALCFPSVGYLLTKTSVSDGMGGGTVTWGTVGTVACRIDRASAGYERQSGGGIESWQGWVLSLTHDTTITEAYRVVVGSSTFAVKAVDPEKSLNAVLRVYMEQI